MDLDLTASPGHPVSDVELTINGVGGVADPVGNSLIHYTLPTIPTEQADGLPTSGFRNDSIFELGATAWDDLDRAQDADPVLVTVSNPQLRLVRPSPTQPLAGTLPWQVDAHPESGGSIAKVQILLDGSVAATDVAAPYQGTIGLGGRLGPVEVQARVTTTSGLVRTTLPRLVGIAFDPTVRVIAPLDGSTIAPSSTRLIAVVDEQTAWASSVEFLVDGVTVGSDPTAPFSVTWDAGAASLGDHVVTVRATLGDGTIRTSDPVTVTVDATAGSATVTAPAEGAVIGGSVPISVDVTAPSGATIDAVDTPFGSLTHASGATWTGTLDQTGVPPGRDGDRPDGQLDQGRRIGDLRGSTAARPTHRPDERGRADHHPDDRLDQLGGEPAGLGHGQRGRVRPVASSGSTSWPVGSTSATTTRHRTPCPGPPRPMGRTSISARVLLGNGEITDAPSIRVTSAQTRLTITATDGRVAESRGRCI